MERCGEQDFRVCDLAIAPRTLTAVAFPPNVTYLRVEQCVFVAAVSGGSGVGSEEEEAEEVLECLTDPLPAEYYGVTIYHGAAATTGSGSSAGSGSASVLTSSPSSWSHWPSSVDVSYSAVGALCEKVTNVDAALYNNTALWGSRSALLSVVCLFDAESRLFLAMCSPVFAASGKEIRGERVGQASLGVPYFFFWREGGSHTTYVSD